MYYSRKRLFSFFYSDILEKYLMNLFDYEKSLVAEHLKKALKFTEQPKARNLFVFDLDSTLFCMKYRTQAIIDSCLREEEFRYQFSDKIEKIKKIKVTERDWSVKEIMSRYGFSPEEPCVLFMNKYWKRSFFKNTYLHLDRPYKGCVEFVNRIASGNTVIFYLTARNHTTMLEGTIKSLKKWRFSFEDEKKLIMKENTETEDAIYKTEELKQLRKKYKTILFFENEPVILNRVAQDIPDIHLFWIDSTHSHREKPPETALPLPINYGTEFLNLKS